jgi:hypothetical protein
MPDFIDKKVNKLNFIKIGDKQSKRDVPTIVSGKKPVDTTSVSNNIQSETSTENGNAITKFNVHQIANGMSQKAMKMNPFNKEEGNPNSFASIFNRDHQHVSGVKRVFRKSFSLMLLSVLSGQVLIFLALNFFGINPLYTLIAAVAYSVFTNIFFIILADRSYFWIQLLAQLLLCVLSYLFMGYSINKISVAILFAICVLIYFAYTEIEKVQLSSRLFSISSVTSEATRILSTVVILFITLSIFNSATHKGIDTYFKENVLDNSFIMDNFVIGNNSKLGSYSLNRFTASTRYTIENDSVKYKEYDLNGGLIFKNATLEHFLTINYRPGEDLISRTEKDDLTAECEKKNDTNCDAKLQALKIDRLEKWKKEAYPSITWPLQTDLNIERYKEVSKQFYLYQIRSFNTEKSTGTKSSGDIGQTLGKYLFLPRNQILPTLLVVTVFILLTLLRPIYNFIVFMCTLILWQILKITKFVRIEVETVEAEVVGI